jgi:anti-anti-sigma regulatory factor
MILKTDIVKNTLIVTLGKLYSNDTISDIVKLDKSEKIHDVENIIIDCTNLQGLDSVGPELFLMRSKFKKIDQNRNFVFCGLNKDGEETFNYFAQGCGYESIINFPSLDEALNFVRKQ